MCSTHRFTPPQRWDPLPERLPQHFEHMPSELGEFIEEEDTMMGQRHLARHGHLAAADQPHVDNGVVGGATRPGGDEGGAPPGEAGDAVDAGGVESFGQGGVESFGQVIVRWHASMALLIAGGLRRGNDEPNTRLACRYANAWRPNTQADLGERLHFSREVCGRIRTYSQRGPIAPPPWSYLDRLAISPYMPTNSPYPRPLIGTSCPLGDR
jgi:hypothetical protein